jgi:hypothetical protein
MRYNIGGAPRAVRTMLMAEWERHPNLPLYDLCFRIEPHCDRRTYHALLAWADQLVETGQTPGRRSS